MEQLADFAPIVQILDALVPQMVDQLVDVLRLSDTVFPEQVIDVPKISQDSIQQRPVDRDLRHSQMAEQLVEVPTVLSPSLLAEQIVDIPVPCGHPTQNSTASVEQYTLTFLFPVEVLTIFPLILGWQLHPQSRVMSWCKGSFRTFPRFQQSAQSAGRSSARVHGHSSSWTPAAYEAEEAVHSGFEYGNLEYNEVWTGSAWVRLLDVGPGTGR